MREEPLILIVDDDLDSRVSLAMLVEFSGYRAALAVDGYEGVEQAILRSPALVLLDLVMPVLSGFEVAGQLKAHPQTRSIPIIAVTGHALSGWQTRAKEAGCVSVLAKGIHPQDLLAEV